MIRVHKPGEAPPILGERGPLLTAQCCRAVAEARAPAFDESVYNHASVKQALAAAQHDKCCYCEARISPASFGDVEHFRPKAAVRQSWASPDLRPGYYWLAYTWNNLFLACEVCNRKYKSTLFPLADPARRARSPEAQEALAGESPLLLDPAADDPERFIGFRDEVPFGRDVRGETTIAFLGLADTPRCEARADVLELVRTLLEMLLIATDVGSPRDADKALGHLLRMSSDRGVYAAMVRAHLRARFGEDLPLPLDGDELRRRLLARRPPGPPPSA